MGLLLLGLVKAFSRNKIFLLLQNLCKMLANHLGPDFWALGGPKEEIAAYSDCQGDFGNHTQCFTAYWLPKYLCEVVHFFFFYQIIINSELLFSQLSARLVSWCLFCRIDLDSQLQDKLVEPSWDIWSRFLNPAIQNVKAPHHHG